MGEEKKKKMIEVNPSVIKRNRANKGAPAAPAVTIYLNGKADKTKKIMCNEVSIDGPCKVVYDRPRGVWIETEAVVTCHCEDGDKVFE